MRWHYTCRMGFCIIIICIGFVFLFNFRQFFSGYDVHKIGLSTLTHGLSDDYWSFVNKYADVYDSRISKCFSEIPNVPDFWDEDLQPGSACKLGHPPEEGH